MSGERKRGLIAFKHFIKRLQQLSTTRERYEREVAEEQERVPDDVKEGHLAILAVKNDEEKPTRFVVELCVLKHPAFLRLLKLAEEEYGFKHKGILSVPCAPEELRWILQHKIWKTTN